MEEPQPSIDRSLLIPLAIGAFAVVGICLLLLALRLGSAQSSPQTIPTGTPVKYMYLGTEPAIVQPTNFPTPTETLGSTEAPIMTEIIPTGGIFSPTASATSQSTVIVLPGASTNTPAATVALSATITPTGSIEPGTTYDDMDSILGYTGNWVGQTGLPNTYKNTLHISNTIGDALQFTFYGEKFQFTYQAGPTLGAIAINIHGAGSEDNIGFTLDQSAPATSTGEWESALLAPAYYTITITHISGGSINLDSLVLFSLSTPTPTITPTITRTTAP